MLCIPPVALCVVDQTITLVGQSSSYWAGTYTEAREANPLFRWLMAQHPMAFEAGILAWILLFCVGIMALPRLPAMVASIAIVLGHTWGTASWLVIQVRHGYWIAIGLFLLSAIVIVWSWERHCGVGQLMQ